MNSESSGRVSGGGRQAAALAIARAAADFPELDPQRLPLEGLDPREARLALAIHRTTLQRWLTLAHLLDRHLQRRLVSLEPALQGVLLTAAAQLVFMDRLPAHAVVHDAVSLAREHVRPGAAGLANAVLRRVAQMTDQPVRGKPWAPAADRLPLDEGYAVLTGAYLPPVQELARHLSVATSHPLPLVLRWLQQLGAEAAPAVCGQGTINPPTIVAVEPGFSLQPVATPSPWIPHEREGFVLWEGSREELVQFLAGHPQRRVQDPAAAQAVASLIDLTPPPRLIVDYCAGRGTKTRQLLAAFPDAEVIASDVDLVRLEDLRTALGEEPSVRIGRIEQVKALLAGRQADLVVLDVPCSNTGVLARRPEARYRFSAAGLQSVMALQRRIIQQGAAPLRRDGWLLYSTCSLEPEENQQQAQWAAGELGAHLQRESLTLPEGHGACHHDGSYHALLSIRS